MGLNINVDGEKIYRWIHDKIQDFSFVILLLVLSAFFLLFLFAQIDISKINLLKIGLILLILSILSTILWSARRMPENKKGYVGIAIAIYCEDGKDSQRIKSDFINNLEKLLAKDSKRSEFSIINIPETHAKRIKNSEDVRRVLQKSKCHFIIFGEAKKRILDGKERHVLTLESGMVHASILIGLSKLISNEMDEVFPRRLHIDTENDLFNFEFTSEWINYAARYFIGIAASISGDLKYSEKIFCDLYADNALKNNNFPPIKKMVQRLPIRLGEIYSYWASRQYDEWQKNKQNIKLVDDMWENVSKLKRYHPKQYNGMLLTAIYHFLINRNVGLAIKTLNKCQGIHDATWRYSLAFLYAYRGEMKKARKIYDRAFRCCCNPGIGMQTEEFILWVLENEPHQIQLYFCLGLINWKGKEDLQSAKNDFGKILEDKSDKFTEEKRLATIYIKDIESKMIKTPGVNNAAPHGDQQ